MSLREFEATVASLPPDELSKFREWFVEFDATRFDKRIECDVSSGRLDSLAEAALREHMDGKSTSL